MRLVANKPCSFGGKKFYIGDEVPADLVLNPTEQVKRGILSKLNGSTVADENSATNEPGLEDMVAMVGEVKFAIPIHGSNGDVNIEITEIELATFSEIRQNPATSTKDRQDIEAIISEISSEDLLIMLDALDGRKCVKSAVEKRYEEVKAINETINETEVAPESGE